MQTARQIKYKRLLLKISAAEAMVEHYDARPYNWRVACELYDWKCRLKHHQAMLRHFEIFG